MTQLLLFETPVSNTTPTAISSAVHNGVVPPVVEPDARPQGKRLRGDRIDGHQPGEHRLGDLARLVLLRYDMVAKRRAERAAKVVFRSAK